MRPTRPQATWLIAIWLGFLALPLAGITAYFAAVSHAQVTALRTERAGLRELHELTGSLDGATNAMLEQRCPTSRGLVFDDEFLNVSRRFRTVSDDTGLTYDQDLEGINLADLIAYRLPSAVQRFQAIRSQICARGSEETRVERLHVEHREAQAELILSDGFDDIREALAASATSDAVFRLARSYDATLPISSAAAAAVRRFQLSENAQTAGSALQLLAREISALEDLGATAEVPLDALVQRRISRYETQFVLAFLPALAGLIAAFAGIRLTLGVASVRRDLAAARASAARHEHEASHDALTGLLNRRGFTAYIERCVATNETGGALCLIDIDRFKDINDGYGHQVGDDVLRHVAGLLRRASRSGDGVARLGGDEFAVYLAGSAEGAGIERFLRAVTDAARLPFSTRGALVQYSVSAGAAYLDHAEGGGLDVAMVRADAALYEAKACRRGSFEIQSA